MVVPGSGWFHGILLGTLVDGVELPHRGTGPIIVEAAATSRQSVRVAMAGRDERRGAVTFLYLHAPGDWRPALQLEQRGDAVAARGSNRSAKLGFAPLEAVVQDAFAASSMTLADTTLVVAHTTRRELSLVVERGAQRWSSVVLRTPTLGWTLAQSLVRTGSPFANALTALWLLLLLVPLGYWGWWAGRLRAYVTLGAAVTIAIAMAVAVRMFDIAFPPLWQWCVLAAGVATGMLFGQLTFASARESHGTVDG
jgi:hypothetical protein